MFSWRKKKERERNESLGDLVSTTTLTEAENELTPSPTTVDSQRGASKTDCVEPARKDKEVSLCSSAECITEATSTITEKTSHHSTLHEIQPLDSSGSIGDASYNTEERASSLPGVHRSSVVSTASSVHSYHTALGSPVPSRAAGEKGAAEREVKHLFSSLKDELLQSMREMVLETTAVLEKKIETVEQSLQSRVEEVKKQIEYVKSEMEQQSQAVGTREEPVDNEASAYLSTLQEVNTICVGQYSLMFEEGLA